MDHEISSVLLETDIIIQKRIGLVLRDFGENYAIDIIHASY